MAKESVDHWQRSLDQAGSVVIRSRRQTPALVLLGWVAGALLGISLAFGGSVVGIVVGLLIVAVAVFGGLRTIRTVWDGQPHLVVTANDVQYAGRSVPWSAVTEVVRHSMTVRGDIKTYVWILHGRERLRLPQTLQADMMELEAWLRAVHARRDQAS